MDLVENKHKEELRPQGKFGHVYHQSVPKHGRHHHQTLPRVELSGDPLAFVLVPMVIFVVEWPAWH